MTRPHDNDPNAALDELEAVLRDAWRGPATDGETFRAQVHTRIRRRAARQRALAAAATLLLAVGLGIFVGERGGGDVSGVNGPPEGSLVAGGDERPEGSLAVVNSPTPPNETSSDPGPSEASAGLSHGSLESSVDSSAAANTNGERPIANPPADTERRVPAHWYGPVVHPVDRLTDVPDGYSTLAALTFGRHNGGL